MRYSREPREPREPVRVSSEENITPFQGAFKEASQNVVEEMIGEVISEWGALVVDTAIETAGVVVDVAGAVVVETAGAVADAVSDGL